MTRRKDNAETLSPYDPDRLLQQAIETYNTTLDRNPRDTGVFDQLVDTLRRDQRWSCLEENYHRMLIRLDGDRSRTALRKRLWSELAEIYRHDAFDRESMALKCERAAGALATPLHDVSQRESGQPATLVDTPPRTETSILARLYAHRAPRRTVNGTIKTASPRKILASLRDELENYPEAISLYHRLYDVYAQLGDKDAAWCVASMLRGVNKVTADEQHCFEMQTNTPVFQVPISSARWRRAVWHESINHEQARAMTILAGVLHGELAETPAEVDQTACCQQHRLSMQAPGALGDQLNLVSWLFQVPLPQEVYAPKGLGQVKVLFSSPSSMVVERRDDPIQPASQSFILASAMTYLCPEFFLCCGDVDILELCFEVAWHLESHSPGQDGPRVEQLCDLVRNELPVGVRRRVFAAIDNRSQAAVRSYLDGAILTSIRAGFVVCNDFRAAARGIKLLRATPSLSHARMLRELLRFSVSTEYLQLRRAMGVAVIT